MDELDRWLANRHGVITTAEARALGIGHRRLRTLVRSGPSRRPRLVRLSRGAYAAADLYAAANASERHRLRVVAALRSEPGLYMASHTSAAVAWGLPTLNRCLEVVHLARVGGGATVRRAGYTVHGCYSDEQPATRGDVPTVSCALAVVGTAVLHGFEAGLLAADAALHQELTTDAELRDCLVRHARTPGLAAARAAVEAADGRIESPGESRLRVVLTSLALTWIPQVEIREEDGRLVARVDFLLPELGVVVEFDGAVKYEGPGSAGREALMAEKRREDRIRSLGYGIVRVTWADLRHPARIERWVREAARASSRGRGALLRRPAS